MLLDEIILNIGDKRYVGHVWADPRPAPLGRGPSTALALFQPRAVHRGVPGAPSRASEPAMRTDPAGSLSRLCRRLNSRMFLIPRGRSSAGRARDF